MKFPPRHLQADVGMTLIEVIVAISIMGIVATSAIGLSIASQTGAAAQQRQELAVSIANQTMESVSAQAATTIALSVPSFLLQGRTQVDVTSSWSANATASGWTDTYMDWDTAATGATADLVEITKTLPIQSGTVYTVTTLIGTCYEPANGDCKQLPSVTLPPATTPDGYTQLQRVMVIVRWTVGTSCPPPGGCTFQATSLFDPHVDLTWVSH
ncbi:prepilin-type N-terminal cleavage/methylation domain-containing protein [Cryobacterium algoricola]|uniref:Prepilin-type N-terminal cleavage/methylation domain-containing protein n=1 Tax=Cryobacterium algoricola TaxID=1259183 RepID=A0ABY2IBY6_9MICO|nr:prepilin-type N-terminal cleavage/methylation domain-containing protein [Cryobacterium algoricola]TFB87097.1 prepilin-type N-terminal cleavage/methylation domain-containing protein [Cryobacterium algoricola]